ncbi:sugar transferase [Pseudonocardia sp. MH-G8]|uniref:sugar transferase n=1 Tax=Pseudonocardia sp. MH-G8 TaxID=1854588 RepID=UPI001E5572A1|nr:sugar transferase [Pseudonocardia sp. MH-G8]
MTSDVVSVALAVVVGNVLGLGRAVPVFGDVTPAVGVLAGVLTLSCLYAARAWDVRVLGQGPEEFARVLKGMVTSAVLLGMLGLAMLATAARPWVFGLIPLAAVLAAAGRLGLRARLHRQRNSGSCLVPVLAIGTTDSVADLIVRTRRDVAAGWIVAGACTPTGTGPDGAEQINEVPVLGDLDAVGEVVSRGEHHVVAVAATPGWSSRRLHELAWRLEDTGAELVVDPGLMEVAGPRLHVEPVDGLPLLRLTNPTYTGVSWMVKHCYDRIAAVLLIVILAPVLLMVAVAIKIDDGGPVLFRQTRVGRRGREFRMVKFRSVVVDAEQQGPALVERNYDAGPLLEPRADPRATRAGALLRRYSLDELPQLFNVLTGAMALVGPRPPLPEEVATYAFDARRRLLVKPGLTGLWQISGRSDLSWDESVRLDLRYVENWTPALDLLILRRTVGAVFSGRGAY